MIKYLKKIFNNFIFNIFMVLIILYYLILNDITWVTYYIYLIITFTNKFNNLLLSLYYKHI
ncbi:hypothetical protein U3516DRAFT_171735 [Neocallimastix sp. 'constans']|jgi:hypothetical protein